MPRTPAGANHAPINSTSKSARKDSPMVKRICALLLPPVAGLLLTGLAHASDSDSPPPPPPPPPAPYDEQPVVDGDWEWDVAVREWRLRSRHDTAKNSIQNVR